MQYIALALGYGSLLHPRSVARTIPDFLDRGVELLPVRLYGWRRTWTAVAPNEHQLATANGLIPRWQAWMNVERDAASVCVGVVFPVTAEDLAALDRRESIYDRVEVTHATQMMRPAAVPPAVRDLPIHVYTATEPWNPNSPELVGIRDDYRALIRLASRLLDDRWQTDGLFARDFEQVNAAHAAMPDILVPDTATVPRYRVD
jgi:hypothetical protein